MVGVPKCAPKILSTKKRGKNRNNTMNGHVA